METRLIFGILVLNWVWADPTSKTEPSDCGFPDQPFAGSVGFFVNRDFVKESPEKWTPRSVNQYAFYRCDAGYTLVEYSHPTEFRQCQNGRWTQSEPQCASNVAADADIFGINLRKVDDLLDLVDGQPNTCIGNLIQKGSSIRFLFSKKHRIYGIKVITDDTSPTAKREWLLTGAREFQSDFQVLDFQVKTSNITDDFLILNEDSSGSYWKSIIVEATSSRVSGLCEIQIFAMPDQCGHPSIPINGRVEWKSFKSTANYFCNEEYTLDPKPSERRCLAGRWQGKEPVCRLSSLSSSSTSSVTSIVFCILFALGFIASLLFMAYVYLNYDLVKKKNPHWKLPSLPFRNQKTEVTARSPNPPDNFYEVPGRVYEEIQDRSTLCDLDDMIGYEAVKDTTDI